MLYQSSIRRGLSLAELMIACSIMTMMAAAVGSLAMTVQTAHRVNTGNGDATQHARVVLERLNRTLQNAVKTVDFPGFFVLSETVGTYTFPDTLIVWRPETGPPAGSSPLFKELVIFRPNPTNPRQLLEITAPNDERTAPAISDSLAWKNEVSAIAMSSTSVTVVLTDLLRVATPSTTSLSTSTQRGAVRFVTVQRPSATEWSQYKSGTLAFQNLSWAQGIRGQNTGLRQTWCRTELQLMPGADAFVNDPNGETSLPFFGSTALYYELSR